MTAGVQTLAEGFRSYHAGPLKCSRCKEMLPPEAFALNLQRSRGRQSTCKACRRKYYYDTPPEVRRERNKRTMTAEQKARKAEYQRQQLYGVDAEAYSRMLESQHGRCAICRCLFVDARRTHVDHDHSSGAVRGLLCARCNSGLGYYETWYVMHKEEVDDYVQR